MNNRKSKSKKRKLSDLEESSGHDSSDKEDDLDSDTDGEQTEDDNDEDSFSDASDSSTNSQSSSSSRSIKPVGKTKNSGAKVLLSDSSESGDETCEKCAICLRSITSQEIGNPEVCDHLFCSVCIIEWSKNSNVCPLDRQQFSIILVRKNKDGNVVKKVPVEEPQAPRVENVELEEFEDTVCEVCGSGDREDIMLLCDICDRGFHTICLTPPLENIPDENEWFCPECDYNAPNSNHIRSNSLEEFYDVPSTFRSLRPRMVRTQLLERIRVTVNRIVENYVLQHPDELDETSISESIGSVLTSDSELEVSDGRPGTSGIASVKPKQKKSRSKTRKRKTTKSHKKTSKRTTRKKTTKRRKVAAGTKRKTIKRRRKVKTTRTKKIKVENEDGTITEKIVKTRTYKRRRQKRKKKKVRVLGPPRRGLRVKSITTPKTVKGRLAQTLGMVPPKKPGQFLPDVKVRPNSHTSAIDLNRARAGIPKLHIFGPRDELQYYSSESEHEDLIGNSSGGVATVAQQRTNISSRIRDRKKAVLALQSHTSAPKPKPVIEPPKSEYVDILGSILDSQAIWHSKNTNVKIKEDGSIEVIKDKSSNNSDKIIKQDDNQKIDVREKNTDGMTTQAPMHPGTGSSPGGFRPYNRNNYGDSRTGQDNSFTPRTGQSPGGVNFNRFGGPARNDREGYTNYLNNIPQGPTPFCRGGPPLRFRMPARQQLRRIPFPPRNRPAWQPEEEEEEEENEDGGGGDNNINEPEDKKDEEENEQTQVKPREEEEDIDLYSDIEISADKTDNSGAEDGGSSYPALGPPPEPPAFLLGLEENGDFGVTESKDKSEVYDPAEPCDSEDEMVIDEHKERSTTPEKKEENKTEVQGTLPTSKLPAETSDPVKNSQKISSEDDDDEDCPIFSIYSTTSREFSQKEEEERQKEIAEERRKIEELKLKDSQKETILSLESNDMQKTPIDESNVPENQTKLTEVTSVEEADSEEAKDAEGRENEEKRHSKEYSPSVDVDQEKSPSTKSERQSRSRSRSIVDEKEKNERRSPSLESNNIRVSKSPSSMNGKSHDSESSPERPIKKCKRSEKKDEDYDSESEPEVMTVTNQEIDDKEKNKDDEEVIEKPHDEEKLEKDLESEGETFSQKVATGLEGLDVEEVSSDNGEGDEFADKRSLSSLSLSELSNASKRTRSPIQSKKKKKNKKRKILRSKSGKNYEEGEIDDSEKDNRLDESFDTSKNEIAEVENENNPKIGEKRKRKSSGSGSERQILGSKENKKVTKAKSKDKDLAWKKPSKKDKNYREGKKRSKDRGRSKSGERKKSKSPSPKKDKKKNKERKKKTDKKKEIERYDVRKIVKNKEIRRTDAFGRDIISKSRSISRSRSRTPVRERSRNMLRRDSRSYSRSRSRSFRRGRSPIRRRYLRSRTRSRSKSLRRSYSRSRSRSRSRKTKKKVKSKDRLKIRSRSRGRKTRSLSRGRRRSFSRSRSRSPVPRVIRSKKSGRSRRSWSHNFSRSPSFSPRRTRSISRSPIRVRRSYSRSVSTSWSRGRSPLPRTSSLEKLTVVLTTKDKKKWKKRKDGKKGRKEEKKRKKTGNSKEVFASGDNVLVSVNFRNNNNTGNSAINSDGRSTRLNSLSPIPGSDTCRKKKKGSEYDAERLSKKSKKSNPISKRVVDVALSNACPKRAKKLTRLSEKDAEVILNRKPVAVIDLDMSPYREQTPSPVNVVVVSDSGSGDEGKEHTPQRPAARAPGIEVEKLQETIGVQSVNVSAPSSPIENGYIPSSGPKTPPEPQIKFSITKPQQLRQIANPLGDDDDDDDDEDDDDEVDEDEVEQPVESLDHRIEMELNPRNELSHKGPNTPPAPRGPSTPKTPPSPQTSPDAYDPFEPTKSRSPSPSQADKENRLSPKVDGKDDQSSGTVQGENAIVSNSISENLDKANDVLLENHDDKIESIDKGEAIPSLDCSSNLVIPNQTAGAPVPDISVNESPITVVITTSQNKSQPPTAQKPYAPILKQLPMVSSATTVPPTSANLTVSSEIFSLPSPTKVRSNTTTTQTAPVTGIQRLQHRLGSPVNRTPNAVKATTEKRSTNEIFSSGKYMIRNATKRNGEQPKQPRPLQDATNETIDITIDMDDSPYSPASSEGDDLFDPPPEPVKPTQSNSKSASSYKTGGKTSHKSPVKQLSKFDLLFGPSGPTLSPLKVGKKANAKATAKGTTVPKLIPKPQKKATAKKIGAHKMDEDQLRILDELPSSAVELQVKDKFLKKLNRQERVVDEVKTVLKPHYARKHITKEEYKDILRRSVPKICHSRSGEINPSKIQSLIEAYVRKFRHAKKKGISVVSKPKTKKTMFS